MNFDTSGLIVLQRENEQKAKEDAQLAEELAQIKQEKEKLNKNPNSNPNPEMEQLKVCSPDKKVHIFLLS